MKPEKRPGGEYWVQYLKQFHTSDVELGKIASEAQPKLLILTHIGRVIGTGNMLIDGVRKGGFKGKIVVGKDLETF